MCVCVCVSLGDGRNLADHPRYERLDGTHLMCVFECVFVSGCFSMSVFFPKKCVCKCVLVCVCVCRIEMVGIWQTITDMSAWMGLISLCVCFSDCECFSVCRCVLVYVSVLKCVPYFLDLPPGL